MSSPVHTPESTTKAPVRLLRGAARRALETVRPLTGQDRDAKRVTGPWQRTSAWLLSVVERDRTGDALLHLLAMLDALKLALCQHAAAAHARHRNEAALAVALDAWRRLRPE